MAIFENVEFLNDQPIIIIAQNAFNESDQPVSLTTPPTADTPKEFKDHVIQVMKDIQSKSGKKVGLGAADAAFGNLKIKFSNAIERIKNKKLKNSYSVIVPFSVLKHMNPDKPGDKLIEDVLKSNGFAKGGKMAGTWNGYWYKKGKGFITTTAFMAAIDQIQIHFLCAEDTKENIAFIKSNHN